MVAPETTAASSGSRARRNPVVFASAVGALVLAVIFGLRVWDADGKDDPTSGPSAAGPSTPGPTTTSPTTTSPTTTSPTTTSPTITSQTPTGCAGLDADQCALAESQSGLVLAGSCAPWTGAPERHAVRCAPKSTPVALEGAPTIYLFRFESTAAMEGAAKQFFANSGIDLEQVTNTDMATPPAADHWNWHGRSDPAGRLYAHFSTSENIARLMWTYDEDLVYVTLASTGGSAANLFEWWRST